MQFSFLSDLCIVHSPSPPQPTYTWFFSLYRNSLPQKKSSISTSFIKFSRWCHTFCVDCRRDWWPPLKLSFAVSHEIFFVHIPGFLLHVHGIFLFVFVFLSCFLLTLYFCTPPISRVFFFVSFSSENVFPLLPTPLSSPNLPSRP